MTVQQLALQYNLWDSICSAVSVSLPDRDADELLRQIADLPIRSSTASRSLGSYRSNGGTPICIRLQFAQETESLIDTFLHELAYLCDHLSNQSGKPYRRGHSPQWKVWARQLGAATQSHGKSDILENLYRQRAKPVAVCEKCGDEIRRIRQLDHRKRYIRVSCRGQLRPI